MHKKNASVYFISMLLLLFSCQQSGNPVSVIQEEGYWEEVSYLMNGLNKIFFVDPENGWIVGDSGRIFHSYNSGNSWHMQNSGTNDKLISVHFTEKEIGFISGYKNTLLYTSNGGDNWNRIIIQEDRSSIYSIIHSNSDNNIWFISNSGQIIFHSPAKSQCQWK